MAIKAIIFDLGGVVVDFSNDRYYSYLSEKSKIPYRKVSRVIEGKYIDSFERGNLTLGKFEEAVAKDLSISKKSVEWYDFYKRTARANEDVEELVDSLHKEYMTAFLSNVDRPRYKHTLEIIDLDLFDFRFASCYLNARKPEAAVFRTVLAQMNLKPNETVFIDNMIENVRGAEKVGITAVHFVSRRLLDRELAKLGL